MGTVLNRVHRDVPVTWTSNRRAPLLQTIAVLDVFPRESYLSEASTALWSTNAQE